MNKICSIFIAFGLSLGLYQELRILSFPHLEDGNSYAWFMFDAENRSDLVRQLPPNWKSRAVSYLMSGAWVDMWGRPDLSAAMVADPSGKFVMVWTPRKQHDASVVIASYYALIYFFICAMLVVFLKEPIIPMLGLFASILGCSPSSLIPYLMPWDLPTMAAWLAIFLAYRWLKEKPAASRPWIGLVIIIILGGLIKETVLVTTLFLFSAPWRWVYRVLTVIGIIICSQRLNWLISGASPAWVFSIKQGMESGVNSWNPLLLWPVLFANAGSLVLMPWLLWRRVRSHRDWPLLAVCGIFIVLQILNDLAWGFYNENRDWLELAPIAWILISELLFQNQSGQPTSKEIAGEMSPTT